MLKLLNSVDDVCEGDFLSSTKLSSKPCIGVVKNIDYVNKSFTYTLANSGFGFVRVSESELPGLVLFRKTGSDLLVLAGQCAYDYVKHKNQ